MGDPNPEQKPFPLTNMDNPGRCVPRVEPEDLPGRSFLLPPGTGGTRDRAKVIECIDTIDPSVSKDKQVIRFRCEFNKGKKMEIFSYADICDHIEKDETWDGDSGFDEILDHQLGVQDTPQNCDRLQDDPLKYQGSSVNFKI